MRRPTPFLPSLCCLLLLLSLCATPSSARLLSSLLSHFTSVSPSPSLSIPISASLLPDGSILYDGSLYTPTPTPTPLLSPSPLTDDPAEPCPESDADALIPPTEGTFYIYLGVCAFLVLSGGLVSGLTIGLFSLSNLELEVLQEDMEAEPADRRRAKRIEPLLREDRHHILLVTLLLTNTLAMEALPEMLDKIVPEWAAVLISVSLVVLFSEIIPQSICTRAPLTVGAMFSPLVWLLLFLLYPIAWPIAKLLDLCIGKEGGTQFLASRSQVTSLLEIIKRHNVLTVEEAKIMQTVVQLRNKTVKDVMIPPQDIYMLNMDDRLSAAKLHEILQAGHSRIPVYRGSSRNNIQGVLLTKRLIVVRPEDEDPVSKYADFRPVWVKPSTDIFSLLDEFQQGRSHLAMVSEHLHDVAMKYHAGQDLDAKTEVAGLVTFEDIIEAVLASPINDEFDAADEAANPSTTTTVAADKRRSATRRIVDPKSAKASTLNEMLKGLTILAEQKGYSNQPGTPRAAPKIPLKRSQTSAALLQKKKGSAQQSPALVPRERMGGVAKKKGGAGDRKKAPSTPSGTGKKKRVTMADAARTQAARGGDDSAYVTLSDIEEDGGGLPSPSARTPSSSSSTTTRLPSSIEPTFAARSQSAATWNPSDDMAIFTPAGADARRKGGFFAQQQSRAPVLVEEMMEDGTIRVTIASDREAAVQHLEQLNKEFNDGKAYDEKMEGEKRERHDEAVEEARQAAPFSSFVSKLFSSADSLKHRKDSDDADDSAPSKAAHHHHASPPHKARRGSAGEGGGDKPTPPNTSPPSSKPSTPPKRNANGDKKKKKVRTARPPAAKSDSPDSSHSSHASPSLQQPLLGSSAGSSHSGSPSIVGSGGLKSALLRPSSTVSMSSEQSRDREGSESREGSEVEEVEEEEEEEEDEVRSPPPQARMVGLPSVLGMPERR